MIEARDKSALRTEQQATQAGHRRHAARQQVAVAAEAVRQDKLRELTDGLPGDSCQNAAHAEARARHSHVDGGNCVPSEHGALHDAQGLDKQLHARNLAELNIDELKALAEAHGIEVVRTDGKRGKLRRADYIVALT